MIDLLAAFLQCDGTLPPLLGLWRSVRGRRKNNFHPRFWCDVSPSPWPWMMCSDAMRAADLKAPPDQE